MMRTTECLCFTSSEQTGKRYDCAVERVDLYSSTRKTGVESKAGKSRKGDKLAEKNSSTVEQDRALFDYSLAYHVREDRSLERVWPKHCTVEEHDFLSWLVDRTDAGASEDPLSAIEALVGPRRQYTNTDVVRDHARRVYRIRKTIRIEERGRNNRPVSFTLLSFVGQPFESDDRKDIRTHKIIAHLAADYAYELAVEPDGTVLPEWATDGLPDVFVMPTDDLIERTIHEADRELFSQRRRQLLAGRTHVAVIRVVRDDGEIFWLHDNAYPVLNRDTGRVKRIIGAVRDVTESYRIQIMLEAQRDIAETLLYGEDSDRALKNAFTQALDLVGLDSGAIYLSGPTGDSVFLWHSIGIGESLQDAVAFIPPEHPLLVETLKAGKLYQRINSAETDSVPALKRALLQDGMKSHGSIPLFDGKTVVGVITFGSHKYDDIPAWSHPMLEAIAAQMGIALSRISAEKAERESSTRYQVLIENSSDGIAFLTPDGTITYINPSGECITGYDAGSIIGQSCFDLIPSDQTAMIQQFLDAIALSEETYTVEFSVQNQRGEEIILNFRARWVNFESPEKSGIILNFYDVTEKRRAEARLMQSHQRFVTVVDNIDDIVLISNHETRKILFANQRAVDKLGDVLNADCRDLLSGKINCPETVLKDTFSDDSTDSSQRLNEFYSDTTNAWYQIRQQAIRWVDNRMVCLHILTDITERKQSEEIRLARKVDSRYRAIFDNASVGILLTDISGRFIEGNDAWRDMVGLEDYPLLGESYHDRVPEEDHEHLDRMRAELIAGKRKSLSFEQKSFTRQGKPIWLQLSIAPIHNENGEVELFITIINNITERRMAEERLLQSELLFRTVFEKSNVGMLILTKEKRVIAVNQALEDLLGYTIDEYNSMSRFAITHPEDLEDTKKSVDNLYDGAPHDVMEKRYIRKDGSTAYVSRTASVIRNEKGEMELGIMMFMDLSEQMRMEEEKRVVLQRRLEAEQKHTEALQIAERTARLASIGVMAGGITHEINQPLNAIGVTAQTLKDLHVHGQISLPDAALELTEDIQSGVKRIGEVITHMRSFWEDPSGEDPNTDISLNLTVEKALDLVNRQVQTHGIHLKVNLSEQDPLVHANELQLEQVVINLISNSIHALDETNERDKQIKLLTEKSDQRAVLEIRDNGPGIPEDLLPVVFDPFVSSRSHEGGTGLGLAIVKMFVEERFRGEVFAENPTQGGARIVIRLPIVRKEDV
ncbi:PAS domain S-box protein [bacterium]|nr:PAS domain S-box protein [bacterium]